MSFTDNTAESQREVLSCAFDLPHPPEKVWRALTDPALLGEWLLPVTGFRPEQGTEFMFRTDPHPPWDGVVNCRVIEVEPLKRLSYAWTVPMLETVVTFTLVPTEHGTRLELVQAGFKEEQKREFGGARYGWRTMGGRLEALLARTS